MVEPVRLECSFLIPVNRDPVLSDGNQHQNIFWEWLDNELSGRFQGITKAPGLYHGSYQDPDTGQKIEDKSFRFIVAIPENRMDELREVLAEACVWFEQKCVYLSVAGRVEFIRPIT